MNSLEMDHHQSNIDAGPLENLRSLLSNPGGANRCNPLFYEICSGTLLTGDVLGAQYMLFTQLQVNVKESEANPITTVW